MTDAEASVRESVRLLPEADSYSRLAEILYLQERFDDGDVALDRARAIDPESGTVYLAEGVGAAMRGRHEEALRAFDRARAVDPANAATRADDLAALVDDMRRAR
jgi:tetratricopeptide (TPR) repeat protein